MASELGVGGSGGGAVFVVQARGVRIARRCCLQGQWERRRSGKIEVCVEVARNRYARNWSRPQWLDAGIVFLDEADAREQHRAAVALAGERNFTIQDACSILQARRGQ